MMEMLKISHVSKKFGSKEIIKDLSLSVEAHSIYGFIGENGAGKTTTMKMVLGLIKPDQGEIFVNGEKVVYGQTNTNSYIGYLPDVPEFYGYMTPTEYLDLCAKLTGLSKDVRLKKIPKLLEIVGLDNSNKRIHGFSRGMKQRLGIAQAMINEPKLLICDEPTSALDPVGRKEILTILEQMKEHTTVLFSTHILSDVERISDRIGFLHNGKLAYEASIDEIKHGDNHSSMNNGFVIELFDDMSTNRCHELFENAGKQYSLEDQNRIICKENKEKTYWEIMNLLKENNILPMKVEFIEPTLESLFMQIVKK